MKLSVVMITRNCVDVLSEALASVEGLWDELLISDQNSTDGTIEVLKQYKARIFSTKSANLGKRKHELINKAKSDWILVLDSDERLSPDLYEEIKKAEKKYSGYKIPYQNYVFGKPVYWGGERYSKVRLFQKKLGTVNEVPLHEEIHIGGTLGHFRGHLHHHSFRNPFQLFSKFTSYALIASKLKKTKNEKLTAQKLFLYGPHMFWARFVREHGYRDGIAGLVLAFAFGYMETLTYWSMLFV